MSEPSFLDLWKQGSECHPLHHTNLVSLPRNYLKGRRSIINSLLACGRYHIPKTLEQQGIDGKDLIGVVERQQLCSKEGTMLRKKPSRLQTSLMAFLPPAIGQTKAACLEASIIVCITWVLMSQTSIDRHYGEIWK